MLRREMFSVINHRSLVCRCCRFSSASTSGGIRSTSLCILSSSLFSFARSIVSFILPFSLALALASSFSFSAKRSFIVRLRLHATQAQPCFPAASNALALPGGNGIFTATPTERITHYTLLRKVVCQMGALPPLETPTRKGGTLPLHGAHTAFSCYPALRLYRLSKSQRGIGVVSLSK